MNLNLDLQITNGSTTYYPVVEGSVTWELERKGTPGKLSFSVVKDDIINFQEGNLVTFNVDGVGVFYGFVFTKKRSKENIISVTAYDQLRYLKNKDTYNYKDFTATELIQKIAKDFNLTVGTLDDTSYKIASRIEDNKTLFDIIQSALDLTIQNTEEMYVLYDDYSKLTLKNISNMKLNVVIDEETAEDFDYTSSIDGETYNKVKLSYDNKASGKRDIYITEDSNNMKNWGILQYTDKLNDNENGVSKADALLSYYNSKTRNLSISNALGDVGVRPGCQMPIFLNIGDVEVNNYMMVEKVKHTFNSSFHTMDLTLRGGEFIA